MNTKESEKIQTPIEFERIQGNSREKKKSRKNPNKYEKIGANLKIILDYSKKSERPRENPKEYEHNPAGFGRIQFIGEESERIRERIQKNSKESV